MNTLEFLQAVWPVRGYYCLGVLLDGGAYRHKVFTHIPELLRAADRLKDTQDVYFCVHSLKQVSIPNPAKKSGLEVRTKANMKEARCFFLDVDVGAPTPRTPKYASQTEAFNGVKTFCRAAGLPFPTVTSSGGGCHVFWPLSDPMSSALWRPHALRLHRLTVALGLKADPARVHDVTSVLRIPGTFNHKNGEKRPVVFLHPGDGATDTSAFIAALDAACEANGVSTSVAEQPLLDGLTNGGGGGNLDAWTGRVPTIEELAAVCGHVANMVEHGGNIPEPAWHKMLPVIRAAQDGERWCHTLSALNYPKYAADAVDRKLAYQEDQGVGPTGCDALDAVFGDTVCSQCPNQGAGKGPVSIANAPKPAPAPTLPPPRSAPAGTPAITVPVPAPYMRSTDGHILVEIEGKDGTPFKTVILDYDLYPVSRQIDGDATINEHVWRATLPHEGVKEFTIPSKLIHNDKALAEALTTHSVYIDPDKTKAVSKYMSAYIKSLQRAQAAEVQHKHLGWADDYKTFVLADKAIHADGTETPALLDANVASIALNGHHMSKRGTLQRQIELMDFFNRADMVAQQFYICAGLGALLFNMSGHQGSIINATGEPGAAKSTSLFTIGSFFGHPQGFVLNGMKDGASKKARHETLAVLCNLPVCLDEITNMAAEEAKEFALGVSQIGGTRTMTQDRKMRIQTGGISKSTLALTTSNTSLHSLLSDDNAAGTAGSMRVTEVEFAKLSDAGKAKADLFLYELAENYGHIGEEFVRYVVQHYDAIRDIVRARIRKIDEIAFIVAGERFYSAKFACTLVACHICNTLGLLPFDVKAIQKWLLDYQLPRMRGIITNEYITPLGVLTAYFEEVNDGVLVLDRETARGNLWEQKLPKGPMRARLEKDIRMLWLAREGFRNFCRRKNANYMQVVSALVAKKIIVNENARKVLGADTHLAMGQSYCYLVDMKHPDVAGKTAELAHIVPGTSPADHKTPKPGKPEPRTIAKPDLKLVE